MKEAILLQYLAELDEKFGGEILKEYKIKKSSKDELKVVLTFDLTKIQTPVKETKVETPIYTQLEIPTIEKEEPKQIVEEPEDDIEDTSKLVLGKPFIPDIDNEEPEEIEDSFIENLNNTSKVVTADSEGNIIFEDEKEEPTSEDQRIKKNPILDTDRSLYKDHYFSNDEMTYINAYLNKEITGPEGAELLGLKVATEFYSLVNRYKRSRNISRPRKTKTEEPKPEKKVISGIRSNQKLTPKDMEDIYNAVKNGEASLADMSRKYKVATSTMTIRMQRHIKANNLEPLNTSRKNSKKNSTTIPSASIGRNNPALDIIDYEYVYQQIKLGDSISALAKDFKVPENSLTNRFKKYCESKGLDFHVSAIRAPKKSSTAPSRASNIKKEVSIPEGTEDGWQLASDNKFHLVENGVIVE